MGGDAARLITALTLLLLLKVRERVTSRFLPDMADLIAGTFQVRTPYTDMLRTVHIHNDR